MNPRRSTHGFALGLLLAASLALTACGGSSGGDAASNIGTREVPPAGQNAVRGPVDPVQNALRKLGEGTGQIPAVGPAVEPLVDSLVSLLDVVDGLTSGFQEFITSQDPAALLAGGEKAGTAILSFSSGLQTALLELNRTGQQIPAVGTVLQRLEQFQLAIRQATRGETAGGDISPVTDTLNGLLASLSDLQGQLPGSVQNSPASGLFDAVFSALEDLGVVLDETGQLDGSGTSQAMATLVENLAANLASSLPGGAGEQLTAPLEQFTQTFTGGLAVLLEPLFQTLRGALAPLTGPQAPLAILGGTMGGKDLTTVDRGSFSLPLLKLGDLLAGLAGAGGSIGGAAALQDSLSPGGSIPLVGPLLQDLLGGPGGTAPSLPVIGDLLGSLLAPAAGGGALPISGVLGSGQPLEILTGLLTDLLGMTSTDSSGGLGILGGLLGSVHDLLESLLPG